jgi:uncharacterized protein (DUF362 family)
VESLQPDTLRAVLHAVKRHHPRELIVTGGAGAAETEEVFRVGGLMQVVTDEGVRFVDHNRPPFVPVDLEYRPAADVAGPQIARSRETVGSGEPTGRRSRRLGTGRWKVRQVLPRF